MIGCLISDNFDLKNVDFKKIEILEASNQNEWTIVFIKIESKIPVWQLALELELQETLMAYGFGDGKEQAKADALRILAKRIQPNSPLSR